VKVSKKERVRGISFSFFHFQSLESGIKGKKRAVQARKKGEGVSREPEQASPKERSRPL